MQAKKKPCDGESCAGALQYIWKTVGRKRYCRGCAQKINPTQKAKPTPRKAISPRSSKQEKLDKAYSILRRSYLERNSGCAAKISGICTGRATTVHHRAGRGKNLLDETTWLACCMECHEHIERNPQFSYKMGFSESRLAK